MTITTAKPEAGLTSDEDALMRRLLAAARDELAAAPNHDAPVMVSWRSRCIAIVAVELQQWRLERGEFSAAGRIKSSEALRDLYDSLDRTWLPAHVAARWKMATATIAEIQQAMTGSQLKPQARDFLILQCQLLLMVAICGLRAVTAFFALPCDYALRLSQAGRARLLACLGVLVPVVEVDCQAEQGDQQRGNDVAENEGVHRGQP